MSSAVDVGYDLEHFNSPVPDGLQCSICKKVLKNPKLCKGEGHPFCHYCIHEWLKRKKNCPECKNALTPETLVAPQKCFSRLLEALPISCDYQQRGCYSRISLGSLQDHVRLCEFAPVTCEKCGIQINRKDKKKHEENFCPIEPIIKCKLSEITKTQDKYIRKTDAVFSHVEVMTENQDQIKKGQIEMKNKMERAEEAQKQHQAEMMERMARIEKSQSEQRNEMEKRMERMENTQSELKTSQTETKEIIKRMEGNQNKLKNDVREEIKQQFTLLMEKFNPGVDQPLSNNEIITRSGGPANSQADSK